MTALTANTKRCFVIDGKRVLALIPARGGSKGLPRKNVLNLCGKPLISWSIEHALDCVEIDFTLVSTDDNEIATVAKKSGAEVPFLRPAVLASDTASSADVIIHALDFMEEKGQKFDIIVLLEPTSPLREISDLSGALKTLVNEPKGESVVSVTKAEGHHPAFLYLIAEGALMPYLKSHPNNLRRQEIEDLFFLDGSVYASYVSTFREKRGFYHDRTYPWIVPRYKSLEVDEPIDLIMAEALMLARQQGRI